MSFAETLRFLMQENEVTNYRLAKELHCSQSTIGYWLKGRVPSAEKISAIAAALHTTPGVLLGDTTGSNVDELIHDETIAAYGEAKEYLTESDKHDIAQLIRIRAELNKDSRKKKE